MTNNTPVLLLIFNRPATTSRVFEAIRAARPLQLFIGADGPREGRNEVDLCEQARAAATRVDWPCEVHTLFRDKNLGSGPAVSGAISWFFEHVDQGVILEDDCLPDVSFFYFCDTLLTQYKADTKIMSISGTNLLPGGWHADRQSYLFGHGGVWGWATWKRAWKHFDLRMPDWNKKGNPDKIRKALHSNNWFFYYLGMFRDAAKENDDIWDLQWFHCILNNGGMAINPSVNLVKNIGFGPDATHTTNMDSPYAKLEAGAISLPLKPPVAVKTDKKYLRAIYRHIVYYDKTPVQALKHNARLFIKKLKKEYPA